MKVRSIILWGVLGFVIAVALGLGVAIVTAGYDFWVPVVLSMGAMLLLVIPLVASLAIANATFDLDSSAGRVATRKGLIAIVGMQLLGAVAFVFVAVRAPELTGLLIGVIAVSFALLFGGVFLARRIRRRRPARRVPGEVWSPWSPELRRRKIRRVVQAFTGGTVAGTAVLVGLDVVLDGGEFAPLTWVGFGLSLGCISASLACFVVSLPLVLAARNPLGNDYAVQRAIGRVVLRGKDDPLTEDGKHRAAVYAAIMAVCLPFQISGFTFMFAGMALQQVWTLANNPGSPSAGLTAGLLIFIPLFGGPIVGISVRQAHRVRDYAANHPAHDRMDTTGGKPEN